MSRREWIEYEVFREVKTTTDGWKNRLAFGIGIRDFEDSYVLDVAITAPNGVYVDSGYKDYCVRIIESVVKGILNRYEWASEININVTFL